MANVLKKTQKKKNGYRGGLWTAHRLEGVVKNAGIKPKKKKFKKNLILTPSNDIIVFSIFSVNITRVLCIFR